MNRIVAALILILLCLGACAPGHNSYSHFTVLPSAGWAYNDTITFTPDFADSVTTGRIALALRHSATYPYANIWLEVSSPGSPLDGVPAICDTLNVRLCDPKGRWLGRGTGVSFQLCDTLPRRYTLADSVPVRLRHIMRVDTLLDIEQVGLIFLPADE